MSIDDTAVQALIDDTLTRHGGDVCAANRELYSRRNDPANPNAAADENLAAAEHYMLSRCWVGTGQYSAAQMRAMIRIYHVGKRVLPDNLMRHDPSRPTTPPSAAQVRWALRGVDDGEADRQANNVPAPDLLRSPPAFNDTAQKIKETVGSAWARVTSYGS